jgi:hypothetical protein
MAEPSPSKKFSSAFFNTNSMTPQIILNIIEGIKGIFAYCQQIKIDERIKTAAPPMLLEFENR